MIQSNSIATNSNATPTAGSSVNASGAARAANKPKPVQPDSASGKDPAKVDRREAQIAATREAEKTDRARETAKEQSTERGRLKPEELWDDVVSVSEDGDTVRVSEEGNEELRDSRIGGVEVLEENTNRAAKAASEDRNRIDAPELIEKGAENLQEARREEAQRRAQARKEALEEQRQNEILDRQSAMEAVEQDETRAKEIVEAQLEAAAEEEEQNAEAEDAAAQSNAAAQSQSDFTGVSDAELERMYREGAISRYDYESEMDAREARDEEMRSQTESISNDTVKLNAEKERVTRTNEAIQRAVSDQTSDTLSAEQRLDVIEKLSENVSEKARREEEQGRLWDYQLLT